MICIIFLIIRKSKSKPVKVKLAKISRKLMKLHISLAISGTSLILTHALLMLIKHGIINVFKGSKGMRPDAKDNCIHIK